MSKPLILLGYGGHGRVLVSLARLLGLQMLGYVAPEAATSSSSATDLPYLGTDDALREYAPEAVQLVNGIGSVGNTSLRQTLYQRWSQQGYVFATLIHPSAIVAAETTIETGAQVMAGAIIQAGARIGADTIVNTGASIDHDCVIGNHVHIAPGAVLSGNVHVDDGAHIGTGAVVIQSVRIGRKAIVGAGATVVHDVPAGKTVIGTPARPRRET